MNQHFETFVRLWLLLVALLFVAALVGVIRDYHKKDKL